MNKYKYFSNNIMYTVITVFILSVILCGCSTTYIKVKSNNKTYTVYHKNRFTDKSFDSFSVTIDKVIIRASKYISDINEKSIEETGEAVKEGAIGIGDAVGSGAAAFIKKGL